MKKILVAIALSVSLAVPAQAHGHGGGGGWFGPMLGGMIIGGVLVDAARPKQYYGPPGQTVIIQQPSPPVIVQQYEVRPQCRYENAFSTSGQYLGQIQVCN